MKQLESSTTATQKSRTAHLRCFLCAMYFALNVDVSTCSAADIGVGVYLGRGFPSETDVRLREANGSDLTFHDVRWADQSFSAPIYYGIRVDYWPSESAANGVSLDFTHAKMYARTEQTIAVSGTRNSQSVNRDEVLGDTFSTLAFSHGYNILTLNALHRWLPAAEAHVHNAHPYVGAGLGIAVPHVEVKTATSIVDEFQFAGFVYQVLGGVGYRVDANWDVYAEYKLTYGDLAVDLTGGGQLDVTPVTHHVTVGALFDVR